MKRLQKTLLLMLAVGFLASCAERLEKLPKIGQTEATFFKTAEHAQQALVAAYDPLQWNFTTSNFHFRWVYGDIMSDDAVKGGSGLNDQIGWTLLEEFVATPANVHVNASYEHKYVGIFRANTILEKVPGIEMDEDLKSRIIAEAHFLRAYWYFELVTMFGGVPLVDRILSPDDFDMPRATADEIWTQIETDLAVAMPNLPLKSELSGAELGRATKGAARMLLGKAHVYQEDWTAAETAFEDLISSGEYDLDPDYAHIFTEDGEHGVESVFEINRSPEGGGNWGNVNGSLEGNMTNVFQRARGTFGGWGFNIPTQELVDEYEVDDPRLSASIFREGDEMGDRGTFTKDVTGQEWDYYSAKYFMNEADQTRIIGDPLINGISNDRVMRYADALLLYAEALYHNGKEADARAQVNSVRARARGAASPFIVPDIASSGPDLFDDIVHERRVELALEGHRFFDLVRWGLAPTELADEGFVAGTHELFAIPLKQLQLNPGLEQNSGY